MFKGNIRRAAIASASALTLGIGAAVWATSSASAAPAAPAASTPRCTAADLSVWLNLGEANAAAGTAFYPLEFTNVSNHACHLFGYPGVSALNAQRQAARQRGGPQRAVQGHHGDHRRGRHRARRPGLGRRGQLPRGRLQADDGDLRPGVRARRDALRPRVRPAALVLGEG